MMNEYKKEMDKIHTPEKLVATTLNRIHEEEKMSGKKRGRWIGVSSVTAAAAIIAVVVGLSGGSSPSVNLRYNTVSETVVRPVVYEQTTETAMSVEDYSDYLGLDILHPTKNAEMIKTEINVVYDGGEIAEDIGTVYYNVDGEQMTVRFSKTVAVVPESLAAGQISEVNGQNVLAGVSENGREHMAAFEQNGVQCFLLSYHMEQEKFEAFLLDFLKTSVSAKPF